MFSHIDNMLKKLCSAEIERGSAERNRAIYLLLPRQVKRGNYGNVY